MCNGRQERKYIAPVLKGVGFPGSAVRATSMDSDDDVPCRAGERCCACSGCLAADHARENGVFAWSVVFDLCHAGYVL